MENNNVEHKNILVIEDEGSLLQALSVILREKGYTVLQARDGAEGLNMALKEHPDLILLDIVMPVMDGFTMLDMLRKDSWGINAKVIILTNLSLDDQRLNKVVSDQPSYYLVKSDNTLEQVVEKIQDVLSAGSTEGER